MSAEILLPLARVTDANANPYSGAKWHFYESGTLTPQAVYADADLSTSLGSTVTADSGGKFVSIYFDASKVYRGICENTSGSVTLHDIDPINSIVLANMLGEDGASYIPFLPSGTDAAASDVQTELRRWVWAENFGASPGASATTNTTAIQKAIQAVRGAGFALSTDGIGGGALTAYTSGTVQFGPGVFEISPDILQITQDLGLTLKGRGSRRTNNAVRGATVLLITGTSSGYGIQVKGNGSRGFSIEDMDICYATSGFTGDVLDNYGSPGLSLKRVMLGTNGISGGSRIQTARSCLRSTYDEFQHCVDTVFDGAVDGWWSDDARGSVGEFGGAQAKFTNCVWYDFTSTHAKHAGNRNRPGLSFDTCSFNPISVAPVRCLDLNNVDNLELPVTTFQASTTYAASTEWLRLVNCGGTLHATRFGDLAKCGTIGGILDIRGCFLGGTDGLTLTLGVITSQGNEVSKGTAGFSVVPTAPVSARLGPDLFKSDVTRSYDINADSSNLDVHIVYAATADSSASKFRNVSSRVTIRNNDAKTFSIATTPYSPGIEDTGRTIRNANSGAVVFTLPAIGTPGLKYTFVNDAANTLEVRGPSAGTLFVGSGAAKVSALAASGDVGASITFESLGASGYHMTAQTGSWTLS